ncbi:ornithine aminotransferase [Streptomyces sp. NBRC 110611]|nr:ornithine aminotransferase [Streptomyces sp. NBRC 110611]
MQLPPQPLGAPPGQGVLLADAAGQPDHVLGSVRPLNSRPAGVRSPPLGQLLGRRRTCLRHDRLPWSPEIAVDRPPRGQMALGRCAGELIACEAWVREPPVTARELPENP